MIRRNIVHVNEKQNEKSTLKAKYRTVDYED